jgi:hypothetical protein
MRKQGYTFIELLISLPLIVGIFAVLAGNYIAIKRIFPGSMRQICLQSYARSGLNAMAGNIRLATWASIGGGGNSVTLSLDPNETYNNVSDDVTARYYVSGTDLIYDPNTSVSADETVLLRNVYNVTGIPYFQKSGDLVVVTFKTRESDVIFGTAETSMSTSLKLRNSSG